MFKGELSVLWKAIRRPMFNWWLRIGVWWILAIVAGYCLHTICSSLIVNSHVQSGYYWLFPVADLHQYLPLLVWIVAGQYCCRLCLGITESQGVTFPRQLMWPCFLLVFAQGAAPLLLVVVEELVLEPALNQFLGLNQSIITFPATVRFLFEFDLNSLIIQAIAFAALIVVAPKKRYIPIVLLSAVFVGDIAANLIRILLPFEAFKHEVVQIHSSFQLLGFAFLYVMLLAFVNGKNRAGLVMVSVLICAKATGWLVEELFEIYGAVILKWYSSAMIIVGSGFSLPYQVWPYQLQDLILEQFPAHATVLGYVGYLVPPLVYVLEYMALIAITYFFVFREGRENAIPMSRILKWLWWKS